MKTLGIISQNICLPVKKLVIKCKNCGKEFTDLKFLHIRISDCFPPSRMIDLKTSPPRCPYCKYEYKWEEDYEVVRKERITFSEAILGEIKLNMEVLKDLIKALFENLSKLKEKILQNKALKREYEKFKVFLSMIRDYSEGKYTEVPKWTITAMVFVLLYVLNPIDLIPDIMPVVGFMDDIAVLYLIWQLVKDDLKKYMEWKKLLSNTGFE